MEDFFNAANRFLKRWFTIRGLRVQRNLRACEAAAQNLPAGWVRDQAVVAAMGALRYVYHGAGAGAEYDPRSYTPK